MRLPQIAGAIAATTFETVRDRGGGGCSGQNDESISAPQGGHAGRQARATDTSTQAFDTTIIIAGADWVEVGTLEMPLFGERLSISVC